MKKLLHKYCKSNDNPTLIKMEESNAEIWLKTETTFKDRVTHHSKIEGYIAK
jgi:hypothetical protein